MEEQTYTAQLLDDEFTGPQWLDVVAISPEHAVEAARHRGSLNGWQGERIRIYPHGTANALEATPLFETRI